MCPVGAVFMFCDVGLRQCLDTPIQSAPLLSALKKNIHGIIEKSYIGLIIVSKIHILCI